MRDSDRVEWREFEGLFEWRIDCGPGGVAGGRVGGGRGQICGPSHKARRRVFDVLRALDPALPGRFLTLGLPAEVRSRVAELPTWRDRFAKRLRRELGPEAGAVWAVEPGKGRNPHMHMPVFGVDWSSRDAAIEWVSTAWYESVGSGLAKHLAAGTKVQVLRLGPGLSMYLSNEIAKLAMAIPAWMLGLKTWGYVNRRAVESYLRPLPEWSDVAESGMTAEQGREFGVNVVAEGLKRQGRSPKLARRVRSAWVGEAADKLRERRESRRSRGSRNSRPA